MLGATVAHFFGMSAKQRAMIGGVAWIAFVALRVPHLQHAEWALALLLLSALVLVPLALELANDEDERGGVAVWVALTRLAQLPAAFLLVWACVKPAGNWAAVLSLPWVAMCGMVATLGWQRARRGGWRRSFDRLCGDVGLIFLGVGGAWVFADRAGARPLNFEPAVVALTAVHFHFAGLLLPLLAGRVARALPESRMATRAAVGSLLGVPAVAVSVTATQLGWGTAFESAAGCGLALAGMAVAVLHVRLATEERMGSVVTRGLLLGAGVSLFLGMTLAAAYALRGSVGALAWLDLPTMRAVHGSLNALGFGLCGVLAWGAFKPT